MLSLQPPYTPPSDNIQAALSIPLHALDKSHVGRKLRVVVQIMDVDMTGTHALVTACPSPRPSAATAPKPPSPPPPSSQSSYHSCTSTPDALPNAPAPNCHPNPRPTLVINLTTALMGHSPAATPPRWTAYAPSPQAVAAGSAAGVLVPTPPASNVPRSRLSLVRGECILAVGWLEPSDVVDQVSTPNGYAKPPRAVLDAIFVSPAREPPVGAPERNT